jgi:hypothetical protein
LGPSDGLYAVIQEDSGNDLGEKMFISSSSEHEKDGNELTCHFMAQSGTKYNTNLLVFLLPQTMEVVGLMSFRVLLSGMLAKKDS